MVFPLDAARLVLDNAVVSELLNRLQAAGDPDVHKHAEHAWMAAVQKHGYLQGDQMVFPENIALMVIAAK